MPNRLATETSPYLLQHKDNPVDWYPWGDEALAAARQAEEELRQLQAMLQEQQVSSYLMATATAADP